MPLPPPPQELHYISIFISTLMPSTAVPSSLIPLSSIAVSLSIAIGMEGDASLPMIITIFIPCPNNNQNDRRPSPSRTLTFIVENLQIVWQYLNMNIYGDGMIMIRSNNTNHPPARRHSSWFREVLNRCSNAWRGAGSR